MFYEPIYKYSYGVNQQYLRIRHILDESCARSMNEPATFEFAVGQEFMFLSHSNTQFPDRKSRNGRMQVTHAVRAIPAGAHKLQCSLFYYVFQSAIKEIGVQKGNQLFRACFKRAEECGERNVLLKRYESCSISLS